MVLETLKKKSVLVAMPCHCPHGGVENIVNDLARKLPARGWDVTLGLAGGTRFNIPDRYLAEHPEIPAFPILNSSGTTEGRIQALVAAIEHLAPDIILSARIYDAYEAARRAKLRRPDLRLAVTIQCYEHDYLLALARWASLVDLCVTSGHLIRNACIDLCGMDRDRVVSIPGGVASPTSIMRPPRQSKIRIGYAGRIDQDQKRIFDLVGVAKSLLDRQLDFSLRIVGSGPDAPALKSALADVPGLDCEFSHWIGNRTDYYHFLSTLDVFLHPAAREGVSIAPREAMACGAVPVISEFVGFWTEGHFVPEKNCLSFPVGDIAHATCQILRLANDRALLEALSSQAWGAESGIYSEAGALDAWASAFDGCLARPASPSGSPQDAAADHGRLARLGLSPAAAESIRNFFNIKMVHSCPGSEWPHAHNKPTDAESRRCEEFALRQESAAQAQQNKTSP